MAIINQFPAAGGGGNPTVPSGYDNTIVFLNTITNYASSSHTTRYYSYSPSGNNILYFYNSSGSATGFKNNTFFVLNSIAASVSIRVSKSGITSDGGASGGTITFYPGVLYSIGLLKNNYKKNNSYYMCGYLSIYSNDTLFTTYQASGSNGSAGSTNYSYSFYGDISRT